MKLGACEQEVQTADYLFRRYPFKGNLADLCAYNVERYPHLLQSVSTGGTHRYDILFAFPQQTFGLNANGRFYSDFEPVSQASGFFGALNHLKLLSPEVVNQHHLPFIGGWFVFLAYELISEIEPSIPVFSHEGVPRAFAVRVPVALIYDHLTSELICVAEPSFSECLNEVERDLNALAVEMGAGLGNLNIQIEEEQPECFTSGVEAIKNWIREGDVFQVNLSRLWRADVPESVSPVALYKRLCHSNPAPFAGFSHMNGLSVMSSSPERLLCFRDGWIETRPIAGTRPRGREGRQDISLRDELLAHPKERAEHIMLIDLERNDLGRIAIPGTVEVNELMVVESYQHVHHIVSNVRARPRPDIAAGRMIAAAFPGGTITGCPKVRCMQIISELEASPRGAYTGAMGYISRDGRMDLNILIRTLCMQDHQLFFRAGAGIVADSDPQAELEETRFKAKGLLRALE